MRCSNCGLRLDGVSDVQAIQHVVECLERTAATLRGEVSTLRLLGFVDGLENAQAVVLREPTGRGPYQVVLEFGNLGDASRVYNSLLFSRSRR